jgi:sugar/nucleoside kinase (ribokinase family)
MATRVTVLGDATLDVRAIPSGPMRPRGDVPAGITLGPGGQGANIATRLARRGLRVRLVCRIGPDAAGNLLRGSLAADDVDVVDLGTAATGLVLIVLDAAGERTMLSQRAPLLADAEPLPPPDADWLVVSGYVLLEPVELSTARRHDGPRRVLAGCSLAPPEADGWLARARALAPDLVVLNVDEARVLCTDEVEPAGLSRRLGTTLGATVVVTEADGATVALGSEVVAVAADRVEPAVDTTGAGDAFTAGLVADLADARWPPDAERMRAALAAAGRLAGAVTRVPGAQGRVPGEG